MTDDEAIGRLIALAASDHPALRYGAVFGMLKIDPDAAGAVRGALEGLARDDVQSVQWAARVALERLFTDDDAPITAVQCPEARRRTTPPRGTKQ